MEHDPWWRDLRVAVGAADGSAIVATVRSSLPDDGLQIAGDALLVALHEQTAGAVELARACAQALRRRGRVGDDLLAATLQPTGRDESITALRPLSVDLEALADVLDGGAGSEGRIDLRSGEVWPEPAIEYALETDSEDVDFDDESRWLTVFGEGPADAYRDMLAFIDTIGDPSLAERLQRAVSGKGAFSRFRSTLEHFSPSEFTRWHRFADDARRGRARAWLADNGYEPQIPSAAD